MLAMLMSAGRTPIKVEVSRSLFLNDCYALLNCDFIETVNVKTNAGRIIIVCDEEALIKNNIPMPSVAIADLGRFIYGDCLVFGFDPRHMDDPFTDCPPSVQDILLNAPVLVV